MAIKKIPFNQLGKAGYNRGINRSHVNRIKKDFHEDMIQPAIVSFRDGKYWIVDHQHLATAIYEMNGSDPNTPILCDVRTGLTYEQEADLYYRLNTGTKPLKFNDKLAGLIESKDPVALDFRDTVEQCGYTFGRNISGSFNAMSTGWKIFNSKNGKERLTRVLTLTNACWPSNKVGAQTDIINGMLLFLDRHGDEYQAEHLIKTLSMRDPSDLVKKATTFYKQMDTRSFTKPYCMYTQIVTSYNAGLRNSNKLTAMAPGY